MILHFLITPINCRSDLHILLGPLWGRMLLDVGDSETPDYRRERDGAIRLERSDMVWLYKVFSSVISYPIIANSESPNVGSFLHGRPLPVYLPDPFPPPTTLTELVGSVFKGYVTLQIVPEKFLVFDDRVQACRCGDQFLPGALILLSVLVVTLIASAISWLSLAIARLWAATRGHNLDLSPVRGCWTGSFCAAFFSGPSKTRQRATR